MDFIKKNWALFILVELVFLVLLFVLPMATISVTASGITANLDYTFINLATGTKDLNGVKTLVEASTTFWICLLLAIAGIGVTLTARGIAKGKEKTMLTYIVLSSISIITIFVLIIIGTKGFFVGAGDVPGVETKYKLGSGIMVMLLPLLATLGLGVAGMKEIKK